MPRPFCALWPGMGPKETSGGQLQSSATDTGKGRKKKEKKKVCVCVGGGGRRMRNGRSVREVWNGLREGEGMEWTKGRRGEWNEKRKE